jgi:hypothetical protein
MRRPWVSLRLPFDKIANYFVALLNVIDFPVDSGYEL